MLPKQDHQSRYFPFIKDCDEDDDLFSFPQELLMVMQERHLKMTSSNSNGFDGSLLAGADT